MSVPELGKGDRNERGYRRLALAVGGLVVLLIVVLALVAILA